MSTELLPIQNKLELALISYLWTFGGTIAPALLTDEAAYFDNPGLFTPNPLGTGTVFDGVTWYPGHCGVDMKDILPRVVVTCAQAGGDISYAGYDACSVEVMGYSIGDDAVGQATLHKGLRASLTESMLIAMQAVLNKPAGGDARAVQGFGLDALRFVNQIEARDEKDNVHGVKFNLEATAHLELA